MESRESCDRISELTILSYVDYCDCKDDGNEYATALEILINTAAQIISGVAGQQMAVQVVERTLHQISSQKKETLQ